MELPERLVPNCNSQNKWFQIREERLRRYNSWDHYTTARLQRVLQEELRRTGQLDFYHEWFQIVPVAIRMQRRGFGEVDFQKLDEVEKDLLEELERVEASVVSQVQLFGQLEREAEEWLQTNRELHPTWKAKLAKGYESRLKAVEKRRASFFNKSDDCRDFLFNQLAIKPAPPNKREKRGERSLCDSAMRYMLEHLLKRDEPHRKTLHALCHISRLRKVHQGYIKPLRGKNGRPPEWLRGGRLFPVIRLYGAETLRWSYARPSLQNWPPRMLKVVRAREGHVFIAVDKKQIEAGVAAILADDETEIREWLDPDGDLHRLMACDALNLSRQQWDGMEKERRTAIRQLFKTSRYERLYGGEGTKAKAKEGCPCDLCRKEETGSSAQYRLSTKELSAALARWAARHPKMQRWREEHIRKIQENGNIWLSPFGYRMTSCQPMHVAERQWLNRPMQHAVAMMVNRDAIELDRLGCPLVFQHHDALFAEVRSEEADYWERTMVEVMTRPVPEMKGIRFPVDSKIGKYWTDLK